MIWTFCLSLWQIGTLPCGKAKPCNILALLVLKLWKFIYLAKRFSALAVYPFINWYEKRLLRIHPWYISKCSSWWSCIQKLLTHSLIHFLDSRIPLPFHCIYFHQHHLILSLWLRSRPNQFRNILCGTRFQMLWDIRILHHIVLLCIRFKSAAQLSFLSVGISKSPLQCIQFPVIEMHPGPPSSPL